MNIMMDGNGEKTKGFKGEWCTVKDDKLYIGGMGKEWVNQHGVRHSSRIGHTVHVPLQWTPTARAAGSVHTASLSSRATAVSGVWSLSLLYFYFLFIGSA